MKDVRWKQRFDNFEQAIILLKTPFIEQKEFNDLEKEGIVQRFEYTFELSWKTLKDYLEFSGVILDEATPRKVIKKAFEANLIKDGEVWMEMLVQRNLLSHKYDKKTFDKAFELIKDKYVKVLEDLFNYLKEKAID